MTTRWILAFDQGCTTCRDAVQRVQDTATERIETRSLHDDEVHSLLHRAQGDELTWAPTLLRVDGSTVRTWTGPRMSLRLARVLGAKRSLRVIRALRGANAVTVAPDESRRSLLKAVPGLALGAFVLSGGTAAAAAKESTVRPLTGAAADLLLAKAEQDQAFATLRAHLKGEGYLPVDWHAMETVEDGELVRTAVAELYTKPGADDAMLAYSEDAASGDTGSLCAFRNEETPRVLIVENGEVQEAEPGFQTNAPGKCTMCKLICKAGCGAGGGLLCAGVCGTTGIGAIVCAPACFSVYFYICDEVGCSGNGCAKSKFC